MILSRYRATLQGRDWTDAHFELRLDDLDRPFHVALRRGPGQLALNSMSGGAWNAEEVFPLPQPPGELRHLHVEVFGRRVTVFLGGQRFGFSMGVDQDEVRLNVAAKDMTWEAFVESEEITRLRQANGGRLTTLSLAGRPLRLPEAADPWLEARLLVEPALEGNRDYLHFLGSRPLAGAGQALSVLDLSSQAVAAALTAALLMPAARVAVLRGEAGRDALLARVAEANGLKNLALLPRAEAAKLLQDGPGPLLVQGDDLFGRFGAEIAGLSAARRRAVSFFADAPQPVPGNAVLPCANARIRTGAGWCLNHNAASATAGRRPGLDIAVAAYNAGGYLAECVASLLCRGRDDIRVIVVDDGSTDGSGEAAARHFASDPRVRVERKPNGGCASARNWGRLVSDATHIAFVDADDFVTPDFFADLYDLALYSGCEVTQGGFDFHDATREDPFRPSHEDAAFAGLPRESFGGRPVIRLAARDIIRGQPTIWRKVYRRDFLEAKDIRFPENVRAYDDYIFQMLTLTAAREILMLPGQIYHYRQHPAQDIRQGDERHFYMLQMFRTLLRRSLDEGWPDFGPYAESIMDSIHWSSARLRPGLVDGFLQASARLAVAIRKVHGDGALRPALLDVVQHPDFMYHFRREWSAVEHLGGGPHWAHASGPFEHPDTVRMRQALPSAQ